MGTKNTVLPPTPEIEQVCDLLEQIIDQMLEARETFPLLGEYEANDESLLLLYLIIRDIESVTHLARKDLVLLPSAMKLTRSVFEMSMKTLWMLEPQDPFDREVRWLAQLQTEEVFYDRISKRLDAIGIDSAKTVRIKNEISTFRLNVTGALPKSYKPIAQIPDLASMMKAINEEGKYLTYIFLSQYSHGTHVATGLYRKNLGNEKKFDEYITPKDWAPLLRLCWYCLAKTSERIFEVIGGDANRFLNNDFIQEIQGAIQKIESS